MREYAKGGVSTVTHSLFRFIIYIYRIDFYFPRT